MVNEDFTNSQALNQPVAVPDDRIFNGVTYAKVGNFQI